MNSLLQLKGTFEQENRSPSFRKAILPANGIVTSSHLESLKKNLTNLKQFWIKETICNGALVSAYYNKVAAKSNRISWLLSDGKNKANKTIVGARFTDDGSKHIITHYVQHEVLNTSISQLDLCINVLNRDFDGIMTKEKNESINAQESKYEPDGILKSNFTQIIVDAYYIEKFDTFVANDESIGNAIITLFKTDNEAITLLKKIGIDLQYTSVLDETTILLQPDDLELLKKKAPYLISMAVSDLSLIDSCDFDFVNEKVFSIPNPTNEPVIGVIDTLFDNNVYFAEWVEYHDMLSADIPKQPVDYKHGTAISSIIVDGHNSNPKLDDGCGRFRVRHFGVASARQFSSFSIMKNIEEIIIKNKDIKVWNLSLGSKLEVNKNFISPEAAILDRIQYENNIIFIIAGTNRTVSDPKIMRIGTPADSINSIVVNSVSNDNKPTEYSRCGPVLSFFTKPDISFYGGDDKSPVRVCTSTGEGLVSGTSYAAPWIARKMCYLINILGLSREVAKALIIHASTGWEKQKISSTLIGHGIVPKRIEDIVQSPDDEIQFILSGVSEKYNTYNYNIPVPINKEQHPFIAKATLCYFPYCSRTQGVDYTNTELDISLGRINGTKIKTINNNYQIDAADHFTSEEEARKNFRKWDNIKHIREVSTKGVRDKKAYDTKGLWGVSLKTKERLDEKYGEGINFGLIVSLKEIHGINRIEEFIRHCSLRGWLVNKIEINTRIDIYNISEETIDFDDKF
ncbi:S8 family peptidase [Sulfurospirillum halorespirans]|uniref:Peptidase n=1 Tax=Sulfurospirillum halorespirans DSM 13726 TaxID=1193502 RepID=A0A1D7TII2_9BACT|nr:S8 family peptidase [Sulfurospirillum halorespirans]AOO64797.1 peptidase [Sulfurospirillum halorespirans DSM 13726]